LNYEAKILADTVNLDGAFATGPRITTFQLTLPKFILAELNTHRMFSRNAASSRAIPVKKIIEQVEQFPVMPVFWGKNQAGMQANEELTGQDLELAKERWLLARDIAVTHVRALVDCNLHKQISNRILEPWMWAEVIVTSTTWSNFWKLRCHKDAQPEFRHVAEMMKELYDSNIPVKPYHLDNGYWHLPFVNPEEVDLYKPDVLCKMSVARCARVSYLNHEGTYDIAKDIELADRLWAAGHLSPFEHAARLEKPRQWYANFEGWNAYRYNRKEK